MHPQWAHFLSFSTNFFENYIPDSVTNLLTSRFQDIAGTKRMTPYLAPFIERVCWLFCLMMGLHTNSTVQMSENNRDRCLRLEVIHLSPPLECLLVEQVVPVTTLLNSTMTQMYIHYCTLDTYQEVGWCPQLVAQSQIQHLPINPLYTPVSRSGMRNPEKTLVPRCHQGTKPTHLVPRLNPGRSPPQATCLETWNTIHQCGVKLVE